jgi:endonuclease/exonuclease/phosphatase family metal-dependent hydrolase
MENIELELNFELGKLNKNSNRIIHKLKARNNNASFKNFCKFIEKMSIKKYIKEISKEYEYIQNHYNNQDNIKKIDKYNEFIDAMNQTFKCEYDDKGKCIYKGEDIILYFMFFYIFIDDDRREREKFEIMDNGDIKGYKVLNLQDIFPLEIEPKDNDNINIKDKISDFNKPFIDRIKNKNDSLSNFMKMMGYETKLENISGGVISHVSEILNRPNEAKNKRKISQALIPSAPADALAAVPAVQGEPQKKAQKTVQKTTQNNYTYIRTDTTNSGYYVKYVFVKDKDKDISDTEKKEFFNKILKNMVKTIKQEEIDIEEEELNIKSVSDTDEIKFCEYKEDKNDKNDKNIELAPIRLSNKKFYEKGYFDVSDTIRSKFKFNELDRIIKIQNMSDDFYKNYLKIFSYNVYNNKELSTNVFTNNCNNINSNNFKFICLQEFNKTHIDNTIINNIKLKFSMNFKKNKISINDLIQEGGILNGLIERERVSDRDKYKYKINVRNYNDNYYIIMVPDKLQEKNVNMKYLAILIRKEPNIDLNKYNAFISLLDDTKENKRRRICLAIKESDKEKENNKCIINVHLSTNIEFKIQHSELSYLLNKIIKKEIFFKKSVEKNDKGKRIEVLLDNIIIMGDFNLDAHEIGTEILKSKTIEQNYNANVLFNNIVTRNSLCVDISNGKKNKYEGQNLDNIILLNKNKFKENVKVAVGYNMYSFNNCTKNQNKCEKQILSDHSPIFSCIEINNIEKISTRKKEIESSEDISVKYKDLKNMESAKLLGVIDKLVKKGKITKENILEKL